MSRDYHKDGRPAADDGSPHWSWYGAEKRPAPWHRHSRTRRPTSPGSSYTMPYDNDNVRPSYRHDYKHHVQPMPFGAVIVLFGVAFVVFCGLMYALVEMHQYVRT